jgi:hypothetical protein
LQSIAAARLQQLAAQRTQRTDAAGLTLERMLTSPNGFGLATATPLQLAICRLIDGKPLAGLERVPLLKNAGVYAADIRERATLKWSVGSLRAVASKRPAEAYIVGPIRSGKSLLTAAVAVCATQRCDVSLLGAGEVPRVSVVSLTTDLARVVHGHVTGRVAASAALKKLAIGEPTSDSVMFRHPTGVPIEVKIVAGSRAGGSLVARWSAGVIFDEFTRMVGGSEGVVNFDDARSAVAGRLLPGAQLCGIGSPWAPFGPAFDLVTAHWQKPTPERIVIRAVGPAMNPVFWTPERCEELRRRDPSAFRTDVLGEFADPESTMFSSDDLALVTRRDAVGLGPEPGHFYVAAMDPATRGDAWTLVVATRLAGGKLAVVMARQWQATRGAPLSPDDVLREIAEELRPYNVARVATDQWAADALADIGSRYGLCVASEAITASRKVELFETMRALVLSGGVELPPVRELLEDIRRVRKKVTQNGITIDLPRAAGRHCDYAFAAALALAQPMGEPIAGAHLLQDGWEPWELAEAEKMERKLRGDDDNGDAESELTEWD